jgi:cystathionine beta-synthase
MDGKLDCFVAGLGTGGTMSGAGRFFKEKRPGIRNVGVDPIGSVYYSYFKTKQLSTPHVYKVEGIGEDMLCDAMDFSVLDDVRQVDDRQSFVAGRRLAREEGIFGGGSSGAAVHVAVEVAKELGKGKTVVCVLPDSGAMYVTKFYSDEWMRDNGFVEDRSLGKVADLLNGRRRPVVTARRGERTEEVIAVMRQNGFSQLPVVDAQGKGEGMVHELDLLSALLAQKLRPHDPIDAIIQPLQGMVTPQTAVERLRELLMQDNVAVVSEADRVVAIVTKIDLIEYLATRAA